MSTKKILKKIKATDIKTSFDQNNFCGKVSFKINGVSFEGQFDIDNVGLYAIRLKSDDLNELGKLTEITNNKNDDSAENSDSPTNKTPFTASNGALAEWGVWTGDANCLSPSFQTGDVGFHPNT